MEIMFFILKGCPYCIEAKKWMSELIEKNPEYGKIKIRTIEEKEEKELADSYDYYYVPTYFLDGEKLHEGAVTKDKIKKVFDAYLEKVSQPV